MSSRLDGQPARVLYVDDVDAAPVETLGPRIEHHAAFPNRVNVEFVQVVSRSRVRQRTWERGTGETLACGSGACAVAVVSMLRGRRGSRGVRVELRGGELEIAWAGGDAQRVHDRARRQVFTGSVEIEGS